MSTTPKLPGFGAELSVEETMLDPVYRGSVSQGKPEGMSLASGRCDRMFRKCMMSGDPRSYECDSWMVLC